MLLGLEKDHHFQYQAFRISLLYVNLWFNVCSQGTKQNSRRPMRLCRRRKQQSSSRSSQESSSNLTSMRSLCLQRGTHTPGHH